MTFQGAITKILTMRSGVSKAGNNWQAVDFIVEDTADTQYPESVVITAFNDRVGELTGYAVGNLVRVTFDAKARTYTGKDGVERASQNNTLRKIEAVGAQPVPVAQPQPQPTPPQQPAQAQLWATDPTKPQAGDDLPF